MAKKAVKPTPTKAAASKSVVYGSKGPKSSGNKPEDLQAAWIASRSKAPRSGGFAPADIPDGDYAVQVVSAKVGQYQKGNKQGVKYFKIRYKIVAGEHLDVELNSSDDISSRPVGESGLVAMDLLINRLRSMGIAVEGDESQHIPPIDLSDLPELAAALSNPENESIGQPILSVKVVNNRSTNPDTGKESWFQNVYVNESLTPEQLKEIRKQIG